MALININQSSIFAPYINTGTMLDLGTGRFRHGADGTWILDGGLSHCFGISGRAQTYKSGAAGSFFAQALLNHPDAEGLVYETENAIAGPDRYDDFVPLDKPVSSRISFVNSVEYNLTDFYEFFDKLVEEKIKHKKDYIVESPFVDPATNKPIKIWLPTFVLIDSYSRARSYKGDKQYDENTVDDVSMNTIWLSEGNIKTRIMYDLPNKARKAGFYVILTVHVGEKRDLDPRARTPKQLQYMKHTDKMKNAGASFEFLATTLLQTIKAEVLETKLKQCMYPTTHSNAVEVNRVETMMVRGKNNCSGNMFPFVVSQYQGILNAVTNFQFLRDNNNYGLNMTGNNVNFSTVLSPDVSLTRTNIRKITDEDYKVTRGLELLAQLCFIQTLWSTWRMPEYINARPEDLAEKLSNSTSCTIDRVLNSTGVWSTSKQDRERLTIMDILQLIYGK